MSKEVTGNVCETFSEDNYVYAVRLTTPEKTVCEIGISRPRNDGRRRYSFASENRYTLVVQDGEGTWVDRTLYRGKSISIKKDWNGKDCPFTLFSK